MNPGHWLVSPIGAAALALATLAVAGVAGRLAMAGHGWPCSWRLASLVVAMVVGSLKLL